MEKQNQKTPKLTGLTHLQSWMVIQLQRYRGSTITPKHRADPRTTRYYQLVQGEKLLVDNIRTKVVDELYRKKWLSRMMKDGKVHYAIHNPELSSQMPIAKTKQLDLLNEAAASGVPDTLNHTKQ